MKKWISFCLVIVLLLSVNTGSPTFADGKSSGQLLYEYGFIVGDNGNLMEGQNLTRAQACVLLSEMYGKKSDASQYIFIQNFSDVKARDWFAPYVTFAKTNKWVSGYPDGTFKPNNPVSRQEWSAMLMNALSYTYSWENVILDMNTIGIDFRASNPSAVKRGEAFDGMWKALLTPAKGETTPLGLKLNKLPQSMFSPIETKPAEPVVTNKELEVVSYKINGLTEFEFIFNKPLSKTSPISNGSFVLTQSGNFFLRASKVYLTADGMGARVVTNVPILQNKEMDIVLKNIVAADGTIMAEKKLSSLKFADTTLPQMNSAEIIGDNYIKVTFNKPVQSDEDYAPVVIRNSVPELSNLDFVLNDGKLFLNTVRLTDNNRTAILYTHTKLTSDVTVLAKNSIKDYAGFPLYSTQLTAKYVKDTTAPKISGFRVISPTQIVIVWDENIRAVNRLSTQYYHGNAAQMIDANITDNKIDGRELTLDFSSRPLKPGENTLHILAGSVSDYFGNSNIAQSIVIEMEPDKISPTVLNTPELKDQTTLVIYFSEALRNQNSELINKSNYAVVGEDGKSPEISQVLYDNKQYSVTLKFKNKLSGKYTLKLADIFDLAGNKLVDGGHSFIAKDMTAPNPSNWSAKVFFTTQTEQDIIVFFDKAMNTSGNNSVLDKSNYRINGVSLGTLSPQAVNIRAIDDKTVQITLSTAAGGGINIKSDNAPNSAITAKLVIGRVADASGNLTDSGENTISLAGKSAIRVFGFRYIGNDQCEIVLSDKVVNFDPTDFEIFKSGMYYTITSYNLSENEKGQTVATVSLNMPIHSYQGYFIRGTGQNTKTAFGETFDAMTAYVPMTEYIGASIAKITLNGNYIDNVYYTASTGIVTMEFTSNINSNSVFMLSYEIPGIQIERITADGISVRLHIASADRAKVMVGMNIYQKYPMKDMNDIVIENIQARIEYLR